MKTRCVTRPMALQEASGDGQDGDHSADDIRAGAADVAHIGGAVLIVFAVVAMAEVVRSLRLLAVPSGILVAGLVLVTGPEPGYAVAMIVTGLLVAALALPRGPLRETYGGWQRLTT